MQNLWVIWDGCKWDTGLGHFTHNKQQMKHFLDNICMKQILFSFIFMNFFILDTICSVNKDKPMASCKNQLIKNCLRHFSS